MTGGVTIDTVKIIQTTGDCAFRRRPLVTPEVF